MCDVIDCCVLCFSASVTGSDQRRSAALCRLLRSRQWPALWCHHVRGLQGTCTRAKAARYVYSYEKYMVHVLVRELQSTCTRAGNARYMYSCDGCKVRLLVLGLQSTWTYLCVSCKVRVLVRELQGTLTRARTQVFRLHDSSISIGILILFVQRLILKHQSDRCDLLVDYTIYFMTAVDIYCDVYLEVGRTCSLR